jgi:hypothetical protein
MHTHHPRFTGMYIFALGMRKVQEYFENAEPADVTVAIVATYLCIVKDHVIAI